MSTQPEIPVCPECGSTDINGQSTIYWKDGRWSNEGVEPWEDYHCEAEIDGELCGTSFKVPAWLAIDGRSAVVVAQAHSWIGAPGKEHHKYTRADWRVEVINGHTSRSYPEWVNSMIEQEEGEDFKCSACGRQSLKCSLNPCPAVIEDREC